MEYQKKTEFKVKSTKWHNKGVYWWKYSLQQGSKIHLYRSVKCSNITYSTRNSSQNFIAPAQTKLKGHKVLNNIIKRVRGKQKGKYIAQGILVLNICGEHLAKLEQLDLVTTLEEKRQWYDLFLGLRKFTANTEFHSHLNILQER